ncbi:hypothetical protein OIE66_20485 [Nonomuraea sp. NBC_01738]|uniref:hypothetical protein n=1 Tax=Nonomuraea sp. NBC_01738 TaxID=2976003 RepID=UPI002E0D10D2|nr:hypothetical protein OIE66_20485 [Nonomuraea sp. NBC_01738]
MRLKSIILGSVAAGALLVAGGTALASSSAAGGDTPQKVCGPDFQVKRSAKFAGATAYLLYNAGTGSACAVTIKTADTGKRTKIWSALDVKDAGVVKNEELTVDHTVPVYHYVPAGALVKFSGGTAAASSGGGYEKIR